MRDGWRVVKLVLVNSGLLLGGDLMAHGQELALSGYGTLGYTYEGEDDIGYLRKLPQPQDITTNGSWLTDSKLGVQLDLPITSHWSATAQLLLEHRVNNEPDDLLELAFVRYVPNANWEMRLGRMGLNAYLASDSRQIDYAHLWSRPPTELYGGIFYDTINGLEVNYRHAYQSLNWTFSLQYGSIKQSLEDEFTHEESEASADNTWVGSVMLSSGDWVGLFSYVRVEDLRVDYGPSTAAAGAWLSTVAQMDLGAISDEAQALISEVRLDAEPVEYYDLGISYFDGQWHLQSELFYINGLKRVIPEGLGGYLMLGYAFERVTPYVIGGFFDPANAPYMRVNDWYDAPILGEVLGQVQDHIIGGINTTYIDQRSISLGVRWDVHPLIALKTQWDWVHIERNGYGLWSALGDEQSQRPRDVHVFSLNASFIF